MFGRHVSKKLSAYRHGELSTVDARRVAEHLLYCQRCRKEYEEIKLGALLASQLSHSRSDSQVPSSLWAEVEEALDQAEATRDATPVQVKGAEGIRGDRVKFFSELGGFRFAVLGATLLLIIALGVLWLYSRQRQDKPEIARRGKSDIPAWAVTRIAGQPKIGEQQITERGNLALGEWLMTDDTSRAQISVGEIGEVQVEPNSRIRLVQARQEEHRLALARGKMHAFIWAPPRQFFVDTPSAVAVDLGCTYTLEVNDQGRGLLHVSLGWVAFEWERRESFVPAEAECVTRPGLGPGTPYFSDASAKFQASLEKFDTATADDSARASALDGLLSQARKKDAITLWHLLTRTNEAERGRVYDRLARLISPPKKVTREGILREDHAMIDAWWDKLELGDTDWWRMWKGPLPTQPK